MPEPASRPLDPLIAAALGPCLRSDDPILTCRVLSLIAPYLVITGGNLLQTARLTGIPHRTLCRWQQESPGLRLAILQARSV